MDACVAFSFVFNAENSRTYSGSRSLAQEIQVILYVYPALNFLSPGHRSIYMCVRIGEGVIFVWLIPGFVLESQYKSKFLFWCWKHYVLIIDFCLQSWRNY
jgi:hypothetical protein